MTRRRSELGAGNGRRAPSPQEAAQAHTTAQALRSRLERIAALYDDLAAAHRALAEDVGSGLDVLGEASLYASMPAQEPQPDFLSDRQVGELLGVSAKTVRRMAEDGRLPAPIRVSPRRLRWRRQDLDERLDQS